MRYSPTLIDHFLNPRNAGLMRDPDGVGEEQDAGCGDLARFFLKSARGVVSDVRFQAYGCGPTIAAASAASELITGRALGDVTHLEATEVERAVDGLPEDRKHAADVVARALRAAARACLGGAPEGG
ncbi:MAG: iron-sulfur cluster assembly scaffold protein [Candidatus Rokubacteria bacterium]|nr:iron-sulfur cluster assembly scaffold protein [Candidatus Rokubacteria bacterium]